MKYFTIVSTCCVALVAAAPVVEKRQITADDLINGPCKDVTLIYARASLEPGNMGISMGPQLCWGLKNAFPESVACQGVGGAYDAGLIDNLLPAGTTREAIAEGRRMFELAIEKCPDTKIVAGGYSQGATLLNEVIKDFDSATQDKILGVVLYGYNRNKQHDGKIENFPREKVRVFCNKDDPVCWGTLITAAGHFAYVLNGSGREGTEFLAGKINAT